MHTTRVNPSQVSTKRLDPDFYHPDHLTIERILKEMKGESLKKAGKFWAGPFGSELPSSLYLKQGVPLFRVGNVGNMQVLYDGMAHLDPKVHERLSSSEVHPGDLLIVKASVGEKICRIPDSMPKANITQHIIAIRPNGNVDADYLVAFLFCRFGRSQLVRRSLGSIIQYLGVTDARTVLYPAIGRLAQTYVGDIVRQSLRLRDYAQQLLHRVDLLHDLYIPRQDTLPFGRRTQRVIPTRLSDRLDAEHFPPAVQSYLESYPDLACKLGTLTSDIMTGQTRPEVPVGAGVGQATVTNLSASFIRGELRTVLPPNGTNRRLCAHDLLLCNAAHSKSYIGKEVKRF
jgi:type I restriction enzyme, S subunit